MAKQKVVKKNNSKALKTLKDILGSLISNQKAIDNSKEYRWWVGIIILLFSVILPIIPLTVSTAKTQGSDFVGTYNYKLDVTMAAAATELKAANYSFVVNEDSKELTGSKDSVDLVADDYKNTDSSKAIYSYVDSVTGRVQLEVYYDSRSYSSSSTKDTYVNSFIDYLGSKNLRKLSDNTLKADTDDSSEKYYSPTALVLFKNGLYITVFKPETTTSSSHSYLGSNWKHAKTGENILDTLLSVDSSITANVTNPEYCAAVFNNWLVQFDKAYADQKVINVWYSTGINAAIYLVLILFMGLMIFLLTRGKKNMFNYLKFGQCMEIEFWSALCPALLSLALGFMMTSYASMIFIVTIGMRTMWLSMKQLRPAM